MEFSRDIHCAKYALKERLLSVGYDMMHSRGVKYPKIDYLRIDGGSAEPIALTNDGKAS